MKKHFWRLEYSITLIVIFVVILLLIPTRFIASKEASYISRWNETIQEIDYVFDAMNAHAEIELVQNLKNATSDDEREEIMLNLVKPYFRISEQDKLKKYYTPKFMNNVVVKSRDEYYFENLYLTKNNRIIGIKDIKDEDVFHPVFLMMFDVNGPKAPNIWGKDIFGVNIFIDGNITPIGSGWSLDELKKDCSDKGSGVSCSHYYRIGGDFNE